VKYEVGICDNAKKNGIQDPDLIIEGVVLVIPAPALSGEEDNTSCL
jgi:hypothetical protein